ncbi:MAG: hypothetical protein ACP5D7_06890 [Limnospira sp.]
MARIDYNYSTIFSSIWKSVLKAIATLLSGGFKMEVIPCQK